MAIPESREELIDAVGTNFVRLEKELSTVPAARRREPTLEGHAKDTLMSVHNLVSYLLRSAFA